MLTNNYRGGSLVLLIQARLGVGFGPKAAARSIETIRAAIGKNPRSI